MEVLSKEVHLASYPVGLPTSENFNFVENTIPAPQKGQVLVRNLWMSVDPYMRGRMMQVKSYAPSFKVGEVMQGGAVGQVIESQHGDYKPGDYVTSMLGWRQAFVSDGQGLVKINPQGVPLEAYLGVLGMPGLTAYAGLLRVAALKEGERVFVSGAAGAVGATVCQIAKIKGCYVVGSAGGEEKCAWLKDSLGVDEAIDYKACDDLTQKVATALPEGIDVAFENVGGDSLQAALFNMRDHGRLAICGMISQYNNTAPQAGPNNLILVVGRRLRMEGFIVSDHVDMMADFHRDMAQWIKDGKMQWRVTVDEGIDNAVGAFLKLFSGSNVGKMVVKLGESESL